MGIHCEVRKCTGCGVCAVACMDEKDIAPPLLRKIVLVVPLMLLLPGVFGLGADGVYWSEPIRDLLGGGAAFTTLMLTVYRPLAKELKEETLCQN